MGGVGIEGGKIVSKERVGGGKMVVVDSVEGKVMEDEEVKEYYG